TSARSPWGDNSACSPTRLTERLGTSGPALPGHLAIIVADGPGVLDTWWTGDGRKRFAGPLAAKRASPRRLRPLSRKRRKRNGPRGCREARFSSPDPALPVVPVARVRRRVVIPGGVIAVRERPRVRVVGGRRRRGVIVGGRRVRVHRVGR